MSPKPQLSFSNSGRYRPNEVSVVCTRLRLSRLSVEACLTGARTHSPEGKMGGEYTGAAMSNSPRGLSSNAGATPYGQKGNRDAAHLPTSLWSALMLRTQGWPEITPAGNSLAARMAASRDGLLPYTSAYKVWPLRLMGK